MRVPGNWVEWIRPVLTVALALAVSAVLALATGYSPVVVLAALWEGAFGNLVNLASTLVIFVPLALMGVGVALAFRAGFFNIGAEGQYWMGAIAATWLGIMGAGWPRAVHVLIVLAGAAAAGALYGLIPAVLKAYRGAHEVITTMMLSYVAVAFGHYLIEKGPLMMPGPVPESAPVAASATLPILVPTTELSWGLFFALAGVVAGAALLYRTRWGFSMQILGKNPRAARLAGLSVPMLTVGSLMVSAALAGLAGGLQIAGVSHQLFDSFANQYGYTAIVVALLARNNPWGVIPAALLFAGLQNGAGSMQMNANIPAQLAFVIQGLIVLFVATDRIFDRFLLRRPKPLGADKQGKGMAL